jgi:hypothetical protein
MKSWQWPVACLATVLFAGCSPRLDWREIRPDGSAVSVLFPCKPDRFERQVPMLDARVSLRLASCAADGSTFAFSHFVAAGPGAVTTSMQALRTAVVANVGGGAPEFTSWSAPGATPNVGMARLRVAGTLPDGKAVVGHAVFFVDGLRVHQALVLGTEPPSEAVDTFFGSVKITR